MTDKNSKIYKSINHSYTRIVWTHKIHEKQADILTFECKALKFIKILFSALTTAGIFSLFIETDSFKLKAATAIASFITVVAELCTREFITQTVIDTHVKATVNLIGLRDEYQMLMLNIITEHINTENILNEYSKLEKRKIKVYENLPRTTDLAVKLAEKSLFKNQDNNFAIREKTTIIPDYLKDEDDK